MPKFINKVLTVIFVVFIAQSHAQHVEWMATGATSDDLSETDDYISTIAQNKNYIYVAGVLNRKNSTLGGHVLTPENWTSFLACYEHSGELKWAKKTLGYTPTLAVDKNGDLYYAEGDNSESIAYRLSKYNADGVLLWTQLFSDVTIKSVAVDGNNDCVIAGYYEVTSSPIKVMDTLITRPPSTAALQEEVFIMKLAGSGKLKWFLSSSGGTGSHLENITINNENEIYFIGEYVASSVNPLIIGESELISYRNSYGDVVIGKASSEGTFLWGHTVGGPNRDWGSKIKVNDADELFFTGTFLDSVKVDGKLYYAMGFGYQAMFGKISAQNKIEWFKTAGSTLETEYYPAGGYAVTVWNDNVYFGGSVYRNAVFDPIGQAILATPNDVNSIGYILKCDTHGAIDWILHGKNGESVIQDIVADEKGNIYFGGITSNYFTNKTVAFDDAIVPITNPGIWVENLTIGMINPNLVVTGLQVEQAANELQLSPNPNAGRIKLSTSNPALKGLSIRIINAVGETIWLNTLASAKDNIYDIDVSFAPVGIYSVIIQNNNETTIQKFLKDR